MTQQEIIINSRRNLLIYAERWGVAKACKIFGVSRTTFYKIKKQFIDTGTLAPQVRRKPKMPNEIALSKKKLILRLVRDFPSRGPMFYAYEMRKQGIAISKVTIWHHLKRFGLNHRYQRLLYLERLKKANKPLTERTLRQLKQQFYTAKKGLWPGHVVALDTFYVGNLKGVGRLYQITGIDLCSRYGWAHIYTTKEQTSTVHFVEDVFIPKCFHNNVELESVLTDNGSEFTGSKFQQMLQQYDIQHHRIPKGKPIFNGCCERFQRTILEEFYQPIFRTRFFKTVPEIQEKLDNYLVYYNFQRAHFGAVKTGTTPINIFKTKQNFIRQRFKELLT
jgi:transposase InsO family protein